MKKFHGGRVSAVRLFMCPCACEEGHLDLWVNPEGRALCHILYNSDDCRASHTGPTKENTTFQTVCTIPSSRVLGELKMSKNFSMKHLWIKLSHWEKPDPYLTNLQPPGGVLDETSKLKVFSVFFLLFCLPSWVSWSTGINVPCASEDWCRASVQTRLSTASATSGPILHVGQGFSTLTGYWDHLGNFQKRLIS